MAAAFFDLDRTLIAGASIFPFGVEAWRAGLISNPEIGRFAAGAIGFKLFGDKGDKTEGTRAAVEGGGFSRSAGRGGAASAATADGTGSPRVSKTHQDAS